MLLNLGTWDIRRGPWITCYRKRTATGRWLPLVRVYWTYPSKPLVGFWENLPDSLRSVYMWWHR